MSELLPTANQPIAIVGIGCAFPKAPSTAHFWRNIKQARDGIEDVPASHWSVDAYYDADPARPDMTYGHRGGFLDPAPFDTLEFGIAPRNLEATDTTQLFALLAARDALLDAGYALDASAQTGRYFDRSRTCVILGVTGALELVIPLGARLGHPQWRAGMLEAGVSPTVADEVVERIAAGFVDWQENSFPGLLGNVAAGRVANRFDLGGTNCVVDAACASSLGALHMALLELYSGRADIALSGGIDTFNDIFMYMCFSKTPALSPTGDIRPFHHDGDGTILGEGAGVLVLKRLADAERDGDDIRAVIKGIGSSSDGRGHAIYAPSASGQERALRAAYADADVSPATVELFEAHGTGTRVGDATEVDALTRVLGESEREGSWCALGSVKSMIGHTKAAAGVAGLIKTVLALENKVLPPTIKVDRPLDNLSPGTAPVYLNTHARPWVGTPSHPRRAGLSAFGFGGSNFHCVLEEYGSTKARPDWSGDVTLLCACGDDTESVRQSLTEAVRPLMTMPDESPETQWQLLRSLAAASRRRFEPDRPVRAVLLLERESDATLEERLGHLIAQADSMLQSAPTGSFLARDGIFVGRGQPSGGLGVLFPGQGSQRPDMLKDLACLFPRFLELAEAADEAVGATPATVSSRARLSDVLYPHPAFDDEVRRLQSDQLRNTQFAQPALGVVELAAWSVLEAFGVRAQAFAGHSFGEISALAAAGRLASGDALAIAALRGQLMAGTGEDRGSMLAVAMGGEALSTWLSEQELGVVIANFNGPRQSVLSGPTDAIEAAEAALKAEAVQVVRLPVSAAFHSPVMTDAAAPFSEALGELDFASPAGKPTVFANTTAAAYPSETAAARKTLGEQLTSPVRFTELLEGMYGAGVRTFVEVGPGKVLSNIAKAVLNDSEMGASDTHVLTLDASGGRRGAEADLGTLLASLTALGHPVALGSWDPVAPDFEVTTRSPAVMMITGANRKPSAQRPLPALAPSMQTTDAASAGQAPSKTTAPSAGPLDRPSAPTPTPGVISTTRHAAADTPADIPVDIPAAEMRDVRPSSSPTVSDPGGVEAAIRVLAELQAQTASLHKQYLDTVAQAHESIQRLSPLLGQGAAQPGDASSHHEPNLSPMDMSLSVAATSPPPNPAASPLAPKPARAGDNEEQKHPETDATASAAAESAVLAIVAEKTGYPVEMLSASMELDADLGIDSIKRVEILAALQDAVPALPEPAPDILSSLITLGDVADLIVGETDHTQGNRRVDAGHDAGPTPAIADKLLEVVAQKTGYPTEMLDLTMELDADLGIDSIKRVEILAALEEHLPRSEPPDAQAIAALTTLGDIAAFFESTTPVSSNIPVNVDTIPSPIEATPAGASDTASLLLGVVAEKTGYPVEVLDLDMQLDADLGIDSIKRVEILAALEETLGIAAPADPEALAALDTLGAVLKLLDGSAAQPSMILTPLPDIPPPVIGQEATPLELSTPRPVPLPLGDRERLAIARGAEIVIVDNDEASGHHITAALAEHGIAGQVISWADADQLEPSHSAAGLVLVYPAAPTTSASWVLSQAIQLLGKYAKVLPSGPGDRVLAAITCLGGEFGLGPARAPPQPESASFSGLIKSVAAEWPEVDCKVIDRPLQGADPACLAGDIVDELLLRGPVEVGLAKQRVTLALTPHTPDELEPFVPPAAGGAAPPLVVITGGARGITAALALELAERWPCTCVLLGRTEIDMDEPAWLSQSDDETSIKRSLSEHAEFSTPAALAWAASDILARREVRGTLTAFEAKGLPVHYRSVDVQAGPVLGETLRSLKREFGPIRGIVHGAGVIADRRIEDKAPESVATVFNTKVNAFESLCAALDEPPDWVGVFSSSSARFGRRGQSDYAAANEVLNKQAQTLKERFPTARVVSFNWGPWAGGMVTPELARLFAAEGIGLIGLAPGVELAANALLARQAPDGPIELVVTAKAGQATRDEPNATPAAAEPPGETGAPPAPGASLHDVSSNHPLAYPDARLVDAHKHEVSFDTVPVLNSHILGGQGVLPLVLSAEWLIQAAMHNNPGLYFRGFDDLRTLSPVKVGSATDVVLSASASVAAQHTGSVEVASTLRGEHLTASANVVLSLTPDGPGFADEDKTLVEDTVPAAWLGRPLYDGNVLFHGPALQAITAIEGMSQAGMVARVATAPHPGAWLTHPWRSTWVTDPLALDASFQLMVIWCLEYLGAHSLPTSIASYRQAVRRFPEEGARVEVRIRVVSTHRVVADMRLRTFDGTPLALVHGYECVVDDTLGAAFASNALSPSAISAVGDD